MAPPSVTESSRSGAALSAVSSVRVLLAAVGSTPLVPSSDAVMVSDTFGWPDGIVTSTRTAKLPDTVPVTASVPTGSVQTEPALSLGIQFQPAVELPGTKVVLAGTVAVSVTPEAPRLPLFTAE